MRIRYLPTAGLLAALFAGGLSAAQEPPAGPAGWIKRAAEITNIQADGMPAFQLSARLRVWAPKNQSLDGSYDLIWISPSQWREEISLPGYTRIRVGGPGKYWQKRTLPYEWVQVSDLDSLLDVERLVRLIGDSKLKMAQNISREGKDLSCVEMRFGRTGIRHVCFDKGSGALDLEEGSSSHTTENVMDRRAYSEFRQWGNKIFPWAITGLSAEKAIIQFSVASLTAPQSADPALFQPPPGADEWASCAAIATPKLVNVVPVNASGTAAVTGQRRTVWVYAVIQTNGTLSHVSLETPIDTNLDRAILEAVSRWRFRPIICGGVPVRKETLVGYSY